MTRNAGWSPLPNASLPDVYHADETAMTTAFTHLARPLQIGPMSLKNRMVMSPMTTAYGNDDQTPNERLIRYFEERALGGVGLVTMELITVDEEHRYMHRSMTLADDRYIAFHRELTDRIHAAGAKVQPQLSHTGPESVAPMFGGSQPIGPSVSVAPVWGWASRAIEVEEIPAIIRQYGEAARRAREAGYDGIELHAAHCYNLLASFISPLRNKRTDEYSAFRFESRLKLVCEVLDAIKSQAGRDFPVTLSISGYERYPGGRALDDTQRLAPALVEAGVDCFRVSGGISDSLVTMMVGRSEYGLAHNVAQAESIKNVVDVPVMLVGRVHEPALAEQIVRDGQADLIAMARPLLADPQLPNKVLSGQVERVRRCISCEHCIDSMTTRDNLGCAVNALSGREAEFAGSGLLATDAAPQRKRVVVIGAGAAGLEAARLAAVAGHEVILFERQSRLGGSLLLASTVHSDNERFLNWLVAEVQRLPIDIRLGAEASVAALRALAPDRVIVATGAQVDTAPHTTVSGPDIYTGNMLRGLFTGRITASDWQAHPAWLRLPIVHLLPLFQRWVTPGLLRSLTRLWMPLGKKVLVIGADLAAVELAEFLARRGRRVTVLDAGNKLAPEVGKKRRNEHMDRLDRLRVAVNTGVEIVAIEQRSVHYRSAGNDRQLTADSIVIAGRPVAASTLADTLRDAGLPVSAIGDCTGLGLIAGATQDALEAVAAL